MTIQRWNWDTANPSALHLTPLAQSIIDPSKADYYLNSGVKTYPDIQFNASAQQTQNSYSALINKTQVQNFNHIVWNDLADKVAELQAYYEIPIERRLNYKDSIIQDTLNPYMSPMSPNWQTDGHYNYGKQLKAYKFLLLINALNELPNEWTWSWEQEGITIQPGVVVKGAYLLEIAERINSLLVDLDIGPILFDEQTLINLQNVDILTAIHFQPAYDIAPIINVSDVGLLTKLLVQPNTLTIDTDLICTIYIYGGTDIVATFDLRQSSIITSAITLKDAIHINPNLFIDTNINTNWSFISTHSFSVLFDPTYDLSFRVQLAEAYALQGASFDRLLQSAYLDLQDGQSWRYPERDPEIHNLWYVFQVWDSDDRVDESLYWDQRYEQDDFIANVPITFSSTSKLDGVAPAFFNGVAQIDNISSSGLIYLKNASPNLYIDNYYKAIQSIERFYHSIDPIPTAVTTSASSDSIVTLSLNTNVVPLGGLAPIDEIIHYANCYIRNYDTNLNVSFVYQVDRYMQTLIWDQERLRSNANIVMGSVVTMDAAGAIETSSTCNIQDIDGSGLVYLRNYDQNLGIDYGYGVTQSKERMYIDCGRADAEDKDYQIVFNHIADFHAPVREWVGGTMMIEDVSASGEAEATVWNTYEVKSISGVSYGFTLNSSGYYQSTNAGINSSYSMCELRFSTGSGKLYLDCINYAESNYDFGLISKLDSTLSKSNTADSNAYFSFQGKQSTSIQTVSFTGISLGEHYIWIKYRKDSSVHSGYDKLQFKVRFE